MTTLKSTGSRPILHALTRPPKSPEQKHLMQAVEHNPKFAKKVGIPASAAKKVLHDK